MDNDAGVLDFGHPIQGLTPKEEAFAMAVFQGESQSDAYRIAYKPTHAARATINRLSVTAMAAPRIRARLRQLRLMRESKSMLSASFLSNHVLSKLYQISSDDEHRDQLKALIALGKTHMVGLFNPKANAKELTTATDEALEKRLLDLIERTKKREMIDITPDVRSASAGKG